MCNTSFAINDWAVSVCVLHDNFWQEETDTGCRQLEQTVSMCRPSGVDHSLCCSLCGNMKKTVFRSVRE